MSSTRTRWPIPVLALALALGVGACADEPTGAGATVEDTGCAPMASRACSCEDPGEVGTRTCLGLAWSDCLCPGNGATDASSTDGGADPIVLDPGFRAITPLTAAGQLTSPNYRLRLFVAAPAASEPLVSPHYELTLGAPNPIH